MEPQQPPHNLETLDDNGRAVFVFNVVARSRPTARFMQELVKVLELAGVGMEGVTIFAGSLSSLPTDAGPYLFLRSTSGVAPDGTLEDPGAYRRPGAQFFVHGADLEAAEAMAHAAHDAILAVRNREVVAA
jgi:hypothetical protein